MQFITAKMQDKERFTMIDLLTGNPFDLLVYPEPVLVSHRLTTFQYTLYSFQGFLFATER
jgi:hypothetical protein